MESAFRGEYKTLIDELTQGMEKAKQLQFHVCSTNPSDAQDLLLQRILSSYEKALLMLGWRGPTGKSQVAAMAAAGPMESSLSVDGSPRSDDLSKNFRDTQDYTASKKRKFQPKRTDQVRVNHENGYEGPPDDGYSWRKYGQKDILGAKHPRSYYRCTYRLVQNCLATKQVQRSDEDPTIFEITYKGTHTCNQSANAVPPPPSPEKQEFKHNLHHHHQMEQHNQKLLSLKANLRVNTGEFDKKDVPAQHFTFPSTYDGESQYFPISALVGANHLEAYSSLFLSPATSETNYFSPATYDMNNFGGHSESEIISGHASTTNSPIGGMEFPFDHVDLDPNFPFNASGFFT